MKLTGSQAFALYLASYEIVLEKLRKVEVRRYGSCPRCGANGTEHEIEELVARMRECPLCMTDLVFLGATDKAAALERVVECVRTFPDPDGHSVDERLDEFAKFLGTLVVSAVQNGWFRKDIVDAKTLRKLEEAAQYRLMTDMLNSLHEAATREMFNGLSADHFKKA